MSDVLSKKGRIILVDVKLISCSKKYIMNVNVIYLLQIQNKNNR